MAFLTPSSTSCSLSRTQITVFPVRAFSRLPTLLLYRPSPTWLSPQEARDHKGRLPREAL